MLDRSNLIGQPAYSADTPCLLVDLDALEHNISLMQAFFDGKPCKLRPHFKSHKCSTIARMQMDAGAVGITCAKLGEAEEVAKAGITNILIANQIVGPAKMARLVELARTTEVMVAVDSETNVGELSRAASAAGVTIGALVEIDIGMGRCGVETQEDARDLAALVGQSPGLRFDGLQGYEGHAVLLRSLAQRQSKAWAAMDKVVSARGLLEHSGIPVRIVSGGGTGTYDVAGAYPGIDEVQAGSYALMDWYYHDIRPEFRQAMSVLATVISRARTDTAIVDVGAKGMGAEFGPPRVASLGDASVESMKSEEHTSVKTGFSDVEIGGKLELIPSHGCTTCNLYREFIVHRDGVIVDIWPIEGAGKLR